MTAAALAIGGAALAHGLRPVAGTRAVRTLLVVWSVAAVIAAVFPTNLRGTQENIPRPSTWSPAAWSFAVLPIAGYLLARSLRRVRAGVWPHRPGRHLGGQRLAQHRASFPQPAAGPIGNAGADASSWHLQRGRGGLQIVLLAVAAITLLLPGRRPIAR